MRFDRRLLTHFEWLLPLLAIAVTALGIATVSSASHTPGGDTLSGLAIRQLTWLAGGVAGMLLLVSFDYRRLERRALLVYVITLLLVLAVPVFGRVGGGSRRWLTFGPVSIQPSELVKLGVVVMLARHFARQPAVHLGLREILVPVVIMAVPAALVLTQPDLGTACVIGVVALTMTVFAGLRLRWLAIMAAPLVALAPVLWGHLKTYQQERILTFLNPDRDPLGAGYHVIQSKIAVGSGMVWGKGFLQGTQNHLNFLPEQHTDFIFSVFAEEWGFVGAMVLVSLYVALLLRALVIASRARDRFGVMLVLGVTSIVFWQAIVNLGMTTGLLPVVGITLPFFSYGGSSLLSLLLGTGLVMNVSMRRYLF